MKVSVIRLGVSGLTGLMGKVNTSTISISVSMFSALPSVDPSRDSISGDPGFPSSVESDPSEPLSLRSCVSALLSDPRVTLLSSVPWESPMYLGLFLLSFLLLSFSSSSSSEDDS